MAVVTQSRYNGLLLQPLAKTFRQFVKVRHVLCLGDAGLALFYCQRQPWHSLSSTVTIRHAQ